MNKKYIIILLVLLLINVPTTFVRANDLSNAPIVQVLKDKKVTVNMKNASLDAILTEITKQTRVGYGYQGGVIDSNSKYSLNVSGMSAEEALTALLKDTPYNYTVSNSRVLIVSKPAPVKQVQQQVKKLKIKGKVIDAVTKKPIPGALILVMGTTTGAIADENGYFTLDVQPDGILEVSCLGMKSMVFNGLLTAAKEMIFSLSRDEMAVEDVVVTGYFNKKKENYTGAVTSFTGKELRSISTGNILSSLSMLDPSFAKVTNNIMGSNPNSIPNFEIRGSGSLKAEFEGTNNMPTFILDGFEVKAQKVYDLDPTRVRSMTILKDASAAAIYGSRAANGVVVIETIAPSEGKLRFSYSTSVNFDAADLSDYDLMNSKEKLAYELSAGLYGNPNQTGRPDWIDNDIDRYNSVAKLVATGIYTDWIKLPVKKIGAGHKHSIMVDGGSESFRYSLGLNYSNKSGAMKGSNRDTYGGSVNLQYNLKKLKFSNNTMFDRVSFKNSPFGDFNEYTKLNPYFTPYNADGSINKILYSFTYYDRGYRDEDVPNYYYNSTIPSKDYGMNTTFMNNFSLEYDILDGLKLKASIALTVESDGTEVYKSKDNTVFFDKEIKGSYTQSSSNGHGYDGSAVLTYFKVLGDHDISAGLVYNVTETQKDGATYLVEGFPNANMDHISMGVAYEKDGRPDGLFDIKRLVGFAANIGYSYKSKYLADFSARSDASSIFGSNNRWGTFWSAGLGWNIHKEKFMSDVSWIDLLKIRASMGTTGGQNFSPYESMIMFTYGKKLVYGNSIGAMLMAFGNRDLKWQLIEKKNIGLDWEILNRRFSGTLNFYTEMSKDVLTNVNLAPSLGFVDYRENLGNVKNSGVEVTLRGTPIQSRSGLKWDLFVNMTHNKNRLMSINPALAAFNGAQDKITKNKPMVRYAEGLSMNTIWTNLSLGIDPTTGAEVFIGRDGNVTEDWNSNNYVPYANSDPKIFGNFGTSLFYKGFEFSASLYFKYGGYIYNNTLADKIENVNPNYNGDRRILTDRWKKSGDIAKYKRVSDVSTTQPTSRFVEKENLVQLQAVSAAYQFESEMLKKARIERLRVSAICNDVFTSSTVRMERGIQYPFARTFSLALQITF